MAPSLPQPNVEVRSQGRVPAWGALASVALVVLAVITASGTVSAGAAPAPAAGAGELSVERLVVAAEVGDLETAVPLADHRTGASAHEPDLCADAMSTSSHVIPGSETAGTLEVSPASLEVRGLQPGTRYRSCVVVFNRHEDPMTYTLSGAELVGEPDPTRPVRLVDPPTGPGTWLAFAKRRIELAPGERAVVPWVLHLPKELPSGTVVPAVRVSQQPIGSNRSGPVVIGSVLQRLYLTFPGGDARRLRVVDIDAPRLLSRARHDRIYRARFTVRNEGEVFDGFTANLEVRSLGRRVGRGSAGQVAVLPGSAARVQVDWDDLPWIGLYSPRIVLVRAGPDQVVELPRVLVLPPRGYLIGLLLALSVPIIALVDFVRRNRRRARRRAAGAPPRAH